MHRITKVLVAALIAVMVLAGCEVDPERRNELVIIKVNDTELTYATVDQILQQTYATYEQQNSVSLSGTDKETADLKKSIQQNVLDYLIDGLVQQEKAKELGLDVPTAEELTQLEQDAQTELDGEAEWVIGQYGFTDAEEKTAYDQAIEFLVQLGYTKEYLTEMNKQELWLEKLKNHFSGDISVTEEEILERYNQRLISDQQTYQATPLQYSTDVSAGGHPCYRPSGFKQIKHILIATDYAKEEALRELSYDLTDEQAKESPDQAVVDDLQKQIDDLRAEALAEILPKAEAALERAQAGEDFDALIDELGEDPGMTFSVEKELGYLIRPDSNYVPEFLDAVAGLSEVGQLSGLVGTTYGYHILKLIGIVPEGAVPIAEARGGLEEDLRAEKSDARFTELTAEWVSAANVKTWPNRL